MLLLQLDGLTVHRLERDLKLESLTQELSEDLVPEEYAMRIQHAPLCQPVVNTLDIDWRDQLRELLCYRDIPKRPRRF